MEHGARGASSSSASATVSNISPSLLTASPSSPIGITDAVESTAERTVESTAENTAESTVESTAESTAAPGEPSEPDPAEAEEVGNGEVIEVDLHRTFPKHQSISSEQGQQVLRRILRAYSLYHPQVGYCQGMNFVAGLFLSVLGQQREQEEQVFWLLASMIGERCTRHRYAGMFMPGMPLAAQSLHCGSQLLKKHLPRLHSHFESEGLQPAMYLTKWLVPCFSVSFGFEFALRVFDVFLLEGWKVVYRVALALLKLSEPQLLDRPLEDMMDYLQVDLPALTATPKFRDEVFVQAFRFRIKSAQLRRWEAGCTTITRWPSDFYVRKGQSGGAS